MDQKKKKREDSSYQNQNDEEDITINSTEIRSIINEYYEQLYFNKRELGWKAHIPRQPQTRKTHLGKEQKTWKNL